MDKMKYLNKISSSWPKGEPTKGNQICYIEMVMRINPTFLGLIWIFPGCCKCLLPPSGQKVTSPFGLQPVRLPVFSIIPTLFISPPQMSAGFLKLTVYFDVPLPRRNLTNSHTNTFLSWEHLSVQQSVTFLFHRHDITHVCAHVSSSVLKNINFVPEAEKCKYFFLLTSNCKSVFRYLTKCAIQIERCDIFAETVQIKGFYIWKKLQKPPVWSVNTSPNTSQRSKPASCTKMLEISFKHW